MSSTTKQENSTIPIVLLIGPTRVFVQGTSHHVAQYGGDYWRQAVFYYILLQYAHHPIDIKGTVGSVQFQYVEQKDDKAQEPHFVDISQEDVSAVTEQIKEVLRQNSTFRIRRMRQRRL